MSTTAISKINQAATLLNDAVYELQGAEPAWLSSARGELGVREIPGPQHAERVLEYLATCRRDVGGNIGKWGAGRDETAWCAAFVGWCLLRSGLEGTRSAAARSYLDYGVRLEQPRVGCIVVLNREGGYHVALWTGQTGSDHLLLGGNQDDSVSIKAYPPGRVLGFRWPEGVSP